jgi:chitinase
LGFRLDAGSGALFRLSFPQEAHPMSSGSRRFLTVLCAAFACVAAMAPIARAQDAAQAKLTKRIVGDYVYYSKYQTPPYSHEQIPFQMLTHINHAGVGFNADGSLSTPQGFLEPELINLAHAAGVKVLLLLGGDFTGVEASGTLSTLVDNILAFEKEHGYDGVDMDWEYPATAQDRAFFVQLMSALRASNKDYTLSIDVAPWGGYGWDLQHLKLSTDYFNIMMYDCAGPWTEHGQLNSPIFWNWKKDGEWASECEPGGSVHDAADIFLKQVPGEQLNMGTPFYGYYYTNINAEFQECPDAADPNSPYYGQCGNPYVLTINYYPQVEQFLKNAGNGWQVYRDPIAMVPYLLHPDGRDGYVTYDDAESTYYRVWYSDWDRGMGGTFMWSLDADYDGHSQVLLSAMYSATLTGK